MSPLSLVRLPPLMERTTGDPTLKVGLIDGPVMADHTGLDATRIRAISGTERFACASSDSQACAHGTFVAGILSGKRGSHAPSICPGCTLLVRPIFGESTGAGMPQATPDELHRALIDCIHQGVRIVNVSAALLQASAAHERLLCDALDQAAARGMIVVAAAGNQGVVASTAITSHPWVIPVVGYDLHGRPMNQTNLSGSIGRRGLGAPGDRITSLGSQGAPRIMGGTSAAAPFVTGAIALLWSEFPSATAAQVRHAVVQPFMRRTTVTPPLLDAEASYRMLRVNPRGQKALQTA